MGTMDAETRRTRAWLPTIAAGLIIGAVETVLAVAFAAIVFGGLLFARLPDGIGLYLVAAVLTLGFLAWRGGRRGVVGSVQDAAAAVLGVAAAAAAARAAELERVAAAAGLSDFDHPDVFLTVIAATLVVTVLCGIVFLVLGARRWGNLIRFMPYPVVGGFLAGTGWLLFKSGMYVAAGTAIRVRSLDDLVRPYEFQRWVPAFVFGVVLLLAVRFVRRPLVIPTVIAVGIVGFAVVAVATGNGLDEIRAGHWLLGPFETSRLWQPWTLRAIGGADWVSVLGSWGVIATAVFVAALALVFNVGGTELILERDLDTNEELRDAGGLNVVSGLLGGIPGYHALSLTSLAERMNVDGRRAGLIAAGVPLAAVVFGGAVVGLIPRMIVGGLLVFVGLAFIVEWVWDTRRSLPRLEYLVVLVILAIVIAQGYLLGIVVGLVFAIVLFVVSYGRVDLVHEVAFGDVYRSAVDRPADERARLRRAADRVQILRLSGFVFFGSTSRLLSRISRRAETDPPSFLVLDLRRVTGVDSSAVVAFAKVVRLADAHGIEVLVTGATDAVRSQLERGGVTAAEGVLRFEPDLDRGLEVCEDALLAATEAEPAGGTPAADGQLPHGLAAHLERAQVPAGTVLLEQDELPGDIFVLTEGRLVVEISTPEGKRVRLRILRPGAVVGEIALYTDAPRTADVVAETDAVVLRCSRERIAAIEAHDPRAAAALHRWLAASMAGRLDETMQGLDALLD